MAKDAKQEAAATEAAPKKSKKLLIIIVAAVVLVLAIGGAAAFFLLKSDHNAEEGDEEVVTEKAQTKKKDSKEAAPVYVALDAFTVNLVPETGDQFLQLIVSVEVADLHVGDQLKTYTPKIRNNVMLLLSSKKASELLAKEGKETLAKDIRDLINEILEPKAKKDEGPVKEVLFTSFIIQ